MIGRRLQKLFDDKTPKLGNALDTNGFPITITDDGAVPRGLMGGANGSQLPVGAALTSAVDVNDFNINDGTFLARKGAVDIYGAATKINGLKQGQTKNSAVQCTPDGLIFPVELPTPGWEVSDTDTGDYPLNLLSVWIEMTGLTVTVPEAVPNGQRVDFSTNIHFVNSATGNNRSGTIDIGYGINGSPPIANTNVFVEVAFDSVVPIAFSTTTLILNANDTITLWCRRATENHSQFSPSADASAGGLHQLIVSSSVAAAAKFAGLNHNHDSRYYEKTIIGTITPDDNKTAGIFIITNMVDSPLLEVFVYSGTNLIYQRRTTIKDVPVIETRQFVNGSNFWTTWRTV